MFERLINFFRGGPRATQGTSFIPVPTGKRMLVDANGNDLTYATCVQILASAMAVCRWGVYDARNTLAPDEAVGLSRVLNVSPYRGMNAYDFWDYIERQRIGYGNAFALIDMDKRTNALARLVPLDSGCMSVVWDDANILEGKRRILYVYRDARTQQTFTLLPEETLHFKAFSSNGIIGRSAITVLHDALVAKGEAEEAVRDAVRNGFAGTIVLSYTSDLSASKQKVLQQQVMELLSESEHTILPLPAGMSATNISNPVREYYETLQSTKIEDIAALFGIPLSMLNRMGGTGVATFSATQMANFYTQTIVPIITRYSAELTAKLLTYKQQDAGYTIATINDVFDAMDAQSKATVLCNYTGAGILTPNEARASIRYPVSDAPGANILSQRGGTGALGDSPGNEQGNKKGE